MEYTGKLRQAHGRAENRIVKLAREMYKFEKYDKNLLGYLQSTQRERINKLARIFLLGMATAHIYGRAFTVGLISEKYAKHVREGAKKRKFSDVNLSGLLGDDIEFPEQIVRYTLKADGSFVARLMHSKVKSSDAVAEFFAVPEHVLREWEEYTLQLAGNEEAQLLIKLHKIIEQGLKSGATDKQIAEEIRKVSEFGLGRVKAIARTESTRAFNVGILTEGLRSDLVVAYRFDAVMDDRTTHICKSRNGKVIPIEDEGLIVHNTPPLHVNCRSVLVPVFEFENADEMDYLTSDVEWELARPQQRQQDLAWLRQTFETARSRTWGLKAMAGTLGVNVPGTIGWTTEQLSKLKLSNSKELTEEQFKQLFLAINPRFRSLNKVTFTYGDPGEGASGYCNPDFAYSMREGKLYYKLRKIEIVVRQGRVGLNSPLHEALHAVRFDWYDKASINLRDVETWVERTLEEGTVDFFTKLITCKLYGGVGVTGCFNEQMVVWANAFEYRGGLKEFVVRLWDARTKLSFKQMFDEGILRISTPAVAKEFVFTKVTDLYSKDEIFKRFYDTIVGKVPEFSEMLIKNDFRAFDKLWDSNNLFRLLFREAMTRYVAYNIDF